METLYQLYRYKFGNSDQLLQFFLLYLATKFQKTSLCTDVFNLILNSFYFWLPSKQFIIHSSLVLMLMSDETAYKIIYKPYKKHVHVPHVSTQTQYH